MNKKIFIILSPILIFIGYFQYLNESLFEKKGIDKQLDREGATIEESQVQDKLIIPNNLAFGEPTRGGLDGRVIKVTNLNSDGPGSLKKALNEKGTRVIVFEVGGVIDLNKSTLVIKEPYVTIAGQTAPSPGITLIKGGIQIRTHDVYLQHLRIRPGDANQEKKSGFEPDGLTTYGSKAYNIIVDHCSISWAVDENLSVSGPRIDKYSTSHNITFSNNIIAEGLYESSHSKGAHSMGSLIHDFVRNVAIVGNFYSCNYDRNPLFKSFTEGIISNNLIYNPGQHAIRLTWVQQELDFMKVPAKNSEVGIIGNVLQKGVDSRKDLAMIMGKGDAYVHDNLAFEMNGDKATVIYKQTKQLKEWSFNDFNFTPIPSNRVEEYVIENVGARPKDRDSVDKRLINDYVNRKGKIINSQTEVGGYPEYSETYRCLDVPDTDRETWLLEFLKTVE